jgi:hypothetical protein
VTKFKEVFEAKKFKKNSRFNLYQLYDDQVKLKYDSNIRKGVAEWTYYATIREVLESGTISKSAKKDVAAAAKRLGMDIDSELWSIWGEIDRDSTDEILHTVKSKGIINGGRIRGNSKDAETSYYFGAKPV